jgi:hypothetical protein
MPSLRRFAILVPAISILAVSARPAFAQTPVEVKDQAGLFKPEAVKKANEAIRELEKKGFLLAIETYPAIPKEMIDRFKALDTKAKNEFFAEWGLKRAKELGGKTIHILLTNDPKHLQVSVAPEAEKSGFTPRDRQTLTRMMLDRLRNMQVDEALLDAVVVTTFVIRRGEK